MFLKLNLLGVPFELPLDFKKESKIKKKAAHKMIMKNKQAYFEKV
jgi:hypothetical protein